MDEEVKIIKLILSYEGNINRDYVDSLNNRVQGKYTDLIPPIMKAM